MFELTKREFLKRQVCVAFPIALLLAFSVFVTPASAAANVMLSPGIVGGPISPTAPQETGILAVTISGAIPDTLTSCTITLQGSTPNFDVDTVSLHLDSNKDGQLNFGDTFLAMLAPGGSGLFATDSFFIPFLMPTGADSFVFGFAFKDAANPSDTFQSKIQPNAVTLTLAGAGPGGAVIQPGIWGVSGGGPAGAAVSFDLPLLSPHPLLRIEPDTTILAFTLSGSPGGDTLTGCTVTLTGLLPAIDVETVALYVDANRNGAFNFGVDTFLTNLLPNGGTGPGYKAPAVFWSMPFGTDSFVVAFNFSNTANVFDTFQVRIEVNDIFLNTAGPGPSSPRILPGIWSVAAPTDTSGLNIWYVNDTSPVGDSFTSATGNDANDGLTPATPKRTLNAIEPWLTQGDTVYMDAGFYYENDTFTIDTNEVSLIGKDSAATVIDFNNTSPVGARAVYAQNVTRLTLRDFRVTNGFNGIRLKNVDTSTIERVRADSSGYTGFELSGGSDSNTLNQVVSSGNGMLGSGMGIHIEFSTRNVIRNSLVQNSKWANINLENTDRNIIENNRVPSGQDQGIRLVTATDNAIRNNYVAASTTYGITLAGSSDRNQITGNTVTGSVSDNLHLDACDSNLIQNNRSEAGLANGLVLVTGADTNIVRGNTFDSNALIGISMWGSGIDNLFENNVITRSNNEGMIIVNATTTRTRVIGNYAALNNGVGFKVDLSTAGNVFAQNTSESNAQYQFYATGSASQDTFEKNNILPSATNADSGFLCDVVTARFSAIRSWWGTTDSVVIRARIAGIGRDSVAYTPWRLGPVDTTPNADTVAPKAPDTVAAVANNWNSVRVSWAGNAINEESSPFAVNLTTYRVYRALTPDSPFWDLRGTLGSSSLSYIDSGLSSSATYRYRVTATDNAAPFENQSFYSDSIPGATTDTAPTSAPPATDTGLFETVVVGALGNDTATTFGQNNSDTLLVSLISASGNDSWTIQLDPTGANNLLRARKVRDTDLAFTDTTRIHGYGYGRNISLELNLYDSAGVERPASYWNTISDSPMITVFFKNSGINPNRAAIFWLNTADSKWYDVTDPVFGMTADTYLRTPDSISIRVNHFTHFFPGEGFVDTVSIVLDTIPSDNVTTGQSIVTVLAFSLFGDTAAGGDTLQTFTIRNDGAADSSHLLNVRLARDANQNGKFDPGADTVVGVLIAGPMPPRTWLGMNMNIPIPPNGESFVISVDVADTAVGNETIQMTIPAFSVKTSDEDTGPLLVKQNPGVLTIIDTTGPNIWYVNDGGTAGDSFTLAPGNGGNNGVSRYSPKNSLAAVMPLLTPGDTVYIDSGTYPVPGTLTLGFSNLGFIGVDSAGTVIDFQDSTLGTNRSGFLANIKNSITIRNMRLRTARRIIDFTNVDSSTIDNVDIQGGYIGIDLTAGSTGNVITNCLIREQAENDGISIQNSDNNRVESCVFRNNFWAIEFPAGLPSNNSFLHANDFLSNGVGAAGGGISLGSGTGNFGGANRFIANSQAIRSQGGTSGNTFIQNTIDSNTFGLFFVGATLDTFAKNNFRWNDTNVNLAAVSNQDLTRNYWDTTDSAQILARMDGIGANRIIYIPYRLGLVATALGADTVAPGKPATFGGLALSESIIQLTWAAPGTSEEPEVVMSAAGFHVWRSLIPDTSLWVVRDTIAWGTVNYTDSGLAPLTAYYYRVTTFDTAAPWVNESFFSDSIVGCTTTMPSPGPNIWYVNDTSLVGDSFTSAIGYDTQSGLTPATPKRNLSSVSPFLTQGDTILVDAGLYTGFQRLFGGTETAGINIDTDNISIIGKDSTSTIIDPSGLKTQAGLFGIFADTQMGLTIQNLAVTGAFIGMKLSDVDLSTISGDSVGSCGNVGITVMGGSDTNTFSNLFIGSNTSDGIDLTSSSNNTLTANVVTKNSSAGAYLLASNSNTITNNTATRNIGVAITFNGSSFNSVKGNSITDNSNVGIDLLNAAQNNRIMQNRIANNYGASGKGIQMAASTSNNIVVQNDIDSNQNYQIVLAGSASNDTFEKNLIRTSPANPDSGVSNVSINTFRFFRRNWWGTTDSAAIKAKIWGAGRDSVVYTPFRLGNVDTAPGADTVAPNAPATVSATPISDSVITVNWTGAPGSEEPEGAPGQMNYFVYRSQNRDTSLWVKLDTVAFGTTTYADSNLGVGFLPLTAYYYRVTTVDATSPFPNESFFSDSIAGCTTTVPAPGPNIWYVNDTSLVGDSFTSAIGADTQNGLSPSTPKRTLNAIEPWLTEGDTVYVDAGFYYENDTFTVDTNSVTIVGVDSVATLVDFADQTRSVYANNMTNLTLRGFGVTNAYNGIWLQNVDSSTLQDLSLNGNGNDGITLETSSHNTLISNSVSGNLACGIMIYFSSNDTLTVNLASGNATDGINVTNSSNNTLTSNIASGNSTGINLISSTGNSLTSNNTSGNSNGIFLSSASDTNTLTSNTSSANTNEGIYLSASSNNTLTSNFSLNNVNCGIVLGGASNNALKSNVVRNNIGDGFKILDDGGGSGSDSNIFIQNTSDSNAGWAFDIFDFGTPVSQSDTFVKNVIITPPYAPWLDSGVTNMTQNRFNFTQNYWMRGGLGTTDSAVIQGMITGAGRDSIIYTPFRLGIVDTAPSADTVAPNAPPAVTATPLSDTAIQVNWTAAVGSEEPEGAPGQINYFIYRSQNRDTSFWVKLDTVSFGVTNYVDSNLGTGLLPLTAYYYRVTTVDAAPKPNESFFSDSIAGCTTTAPSPGPNIWYVNDTSLVGDSFTSAIGFDTQSGLSPSTPKRTLNAIEPWLTEGDTVYVDAGIYLEADTFTIDTNGISVIGKDSAATVINFNDSSVASYRMLYAQNATGLVLRDFHLTNSEYGILFNNVDTSLIERIKIDWVDFHGIRLNSNSSGISINQVHITNTGFIGISASSAPSILIQNSLIENCLSNGIDIGITSTNAQVRLNRLTGNGADGINVSSFNGLYEGNVFFNNANDGVQVSNSNNRFVQNTSDSNGAYAVNVTTTSATDTFQKNLLIATSSRPDSVVTSATSSRIDFTRNWWGTTDSAAIRGKIWGSGRDSVIYTPYRLGIVDTTPGLDTVAPSAPSTVSATPLSDSMIMVTWTAAVGSEEPEGAPGQMWYFVYRSPIAETSLWVKLDTVAFGTTTYTDSNLGVGLLPVTTYYYRITTADGTTIPNESFFSDSIAGATTIIPAPGPNIWYVNDTSLVGDSFTSAIGADTQSGLSPSTPKRTLNAIEPWLTEGDTVYVDAGFYYEADTVTIDTNNVAIVGKDSSATVIRFDQSSAATARAIYAANVTNLTLRGFRVTNGWNGVWFQNVDTSTITQVWSDTNGSHGLFLETGSTGNMLMSNTASGNSLHGIYLATSSNNTLTSNTANFNGNGGIYLNPSSNVTISNNTANSNAWSGITLYSSSNNTVIGNTASSNADRGIYLAASSNNTLTSNTAWNNAMSGFIVTDNGSGTGSDSNIFVQNTSDSNAGWAFDLFDIGTPVSQNDTFVKNVIVTSPYAAYRDSGVANATANRFDFTRNFWMRGGVGTTDSIVIRGMTGGPGRDSIIYSPFRLGIVDTAISGDTVAPRAPDTVAVAALSSNAMTVSWSTSATSEEPEAAPMLNGYRIYRSPTADTSLWVQIGQENSSTTSHADTGLAPSSQYFYRVTVFDISTPENQSFFSDSIANGTTLDAVRVTITSPAIIPGAIDRTAADTTVFAFSISSDAPDTISNIFFRAIGSSPTPNQVETVALYRDGNRNGSFEPGQDTLISSLSPVAPDTWEATAIGVGMSSGADSFLVQFNFYDTASLNDTFQIQIAAKGVDLQIAGSGPAVAVVESGVWTVLAPNTSGANIWYINDTSTVGDSFTSAVGSNLNDGVSPLSPKRFLNDVEALLTPGDTVYVDVGTYFEPDTVTITCSQVAIIGVDSLATIIDFNNTSPSGARGIFAANLTRLTLRNFRVTRAANGILLRNIDSSVVENVQSDQNGDRGFYIILGSDQNTFRNNAADTNPSGGFWLDASIANIFLDNTSRWNGQHGFTLFSSSNANILERNTARDNVYQGYYLANSSNNTVRSNSSRNNLNGFLLQAATNNTFTQNQSEANTGYQFRIETASSNDTFEKNNILPQLINPDSGVFNSSANGHDFTRNWWGSSDSALVKQMIWGSGRDSVIYTPFRLGVVDTTAGADTIAPKAPDTVAVIALTDSTLRITWSVVTLNEEPAGALGLNGYYIYRAPTPTSAAWTQIGMAGPAQNSIDDTGLTAFTTYYYRVTAIDNAAIVNQSFFSDSIIGGMPISDTSGPNVWYVNDTSTVGDSFTSAIGADTQSGLTPATPLRTLTFAMTRLTPRDTVYIDAGTFSETVVINRDSITIIGKDSTATVIDPPGVNATVGLYGIFADTQTNLKISGLGIVDAYNGIHFRNVDISSGNSVRLENCGNYGLYLESGSDSNTFEQIYGLNDGVYIENGSNNAVDSSRLANGNIGLFLMNGSGNKIRDNFLSGNGSYGLYVNLSNNNTLSGNTTSANGAAEIMLIGATGNLVERNLVKGDNIGPGIKLDGADTNVIMLNQVVNNETGIYLVNAAYDNSITKNNLVGNLNFHYGNATGFTQIVSRNWWGTTDTTVIAAKFFESGGSSYTPFRLGQVDTAPGADTIAPAPPTSVIITSGDNRCTITWLAPGVNEEDGQPPADLSGYRIFRSTAPNPSDWGAPIAAVSSLAGDSYTDLAVTNFTTYYYRLTSFDNDTPFDNQSFYTDTIYAATPLPDTSGPNTWYVNDTSTVGDSFTSVIGADTQSGLSPASPKRTLNSLEALLTAGDTVYIDRGVYYEPDTVTLTANNLLIAGMDSVSTQIFFGDTSSASARSLAADNKSGLQIRDLSVSGGQVGISWNNVDTSTIDRVRMMSNGLYGVWIKNGSQSNSLYRVFSMNNGNSGFVIQSSDGNTFNQIAASGHSNYGFYMTAANNCVVTNSIACTNTLSGFHLNSSSNNQIDSSLAYGNGIGGFVADGTSNGNSFRKDTATGNGTGFLLSTSSVISTLIKNDIASGNSTGFSIAGTNTLVIHNRAFSNATAGIKANNDSGSHYAQNQSDSNGGYAVVIAASCTNVVFERNNFVGAPGTPDSLVLSEGSSATMTRNWWGTTDSITLRSRIVGPGSPLIISIPYRLGEVDTAVGADTIAPRAPDTVAVGQQTETAVTVTWSAVTANEDGYAGAPGVNGYAVFRANAQESSSWVFRSSVSAGTFSFTDSGLNVFETHYYRVVAFDAASIFNASFYSDSSVLGLTADSTLPTMPALLTPSAGTDTAATAITFSWSASNDTGGLAGYLLQIDTTNAFAAPFVDSTVGTSTTAIRSLPANDTYFWRVIAADLAGNSIASSSRILRIDTVPPIPPGYNAPVNNLDTNQLIVLFSWAIGLDTGTGIAYYRLQIDTSGTFVSLGMDTTTTGNQLAIGPIPANDTYYWRVVATDSAGNTATIGAFLFLIDTQSPSTPGLIAPANGVETSVALQTFSWSASTDSLAGVRNYRFQIGTDSTFGSTLRDSFTTSLNDSLTLPSTDTYYWSVAAFDSAGNSAAAPVRALRFDNGFPSAPGLLSPSSGDDTNVTTIGFSWSASTDSGGINGYRLQVDTATGTFDTPLIDSFTPALTGSLTLAANGTYSWRVVAVDNTGNTTAASPRLLRIDTAPPSIVTLLMPPNGYDTFTVNGIFAWTTSSDSLSGVSYYRLQIDTNGSFVAPGLDTIVLDTFVMVTSAAVNDTFYWRIITVDSAGNSAASATFLFRIDTQPPAAFTQLAPSNSYDTLSPSIMFWWNASSDTLSGLSGYRLQADTSGTFTSLVVDSATNETSILVTLPANDSYYWRVVARDTAANTTTTATRFVRVDTASPSAVSLLNPPNGYDTKVTTGTLTWTAATDNLTGVQSYRLQIDTSGSFATPLLDTFTTGLSFIGTLPANDTYYWRVIATDTVGNVTSSATRFFRFDTAPPSVPTQILPSNATDTTETTILFSWAASADSLSGIQSYRLQIDTAGTFIAPFVDSVTGLATSGIRTLTANETYYWEVVSTDSAGNSAVSPVRTLHISPLTQPAVVSVHPSLPASANINPVGRDLTGIFAFSVGGNTGDSLTTVTIGLSGNAGRSTIVETMALYRDANRNATLDTAADTLMGNLTATSTTTWRITGLMSAVGTGDSYVLAVSLRDTVTVNDTLRASLPALGIKTLLRDSAPIVALSAVGTFTASYVTVTVVAVDSTSPSSGSITAVDTDRTVVMAVSIRGAVTGDTLTRFHVRLDGAAGNVAVVDSVGLYIDVNENGTYEPSLDALVGKLPWISGATFGASNLAGNLPAWKSGAESFIVVVTLKDTATAGDTLRAVIPVNGVKSTLRDTAPTTDAASPATFTIAAAQTMLAVNALKPIGGSINPVGVDLTGVMAMTIGGAADDSITVLAVNFDGVAGTSLQVDTVFLYQDVDLDGNFTDGLDALIVDMPLSSGAYRLASPYSLGASGIDSFLIVVSIQDTVAGGDTLRAFVLANSVKTALRETVPASATYAPATFITDSGVSTIVRILVNSATLSETIAPLNVDVTRILAMTITGAPGDTLQVFRVRLVGGAGAVTRLDYVALFQDADQNGNYDDGIDVITTLLAWKGVGTQDYEMTGIGFGLGATGSDSFLVIVSMKDSAPSGETIQAVLPSSSIKTSLKDTGAAIDLAAPAAFTIFDLNPPSEFTILSPTSPHDTSVLAVMFLWEATSDPGSGLASYKLQVSRNLAFAPLVVDTTTPFLARSLSPTLAGDDTYYWRVKAYDANGNARTSTDTGEVRIDRTAPSNPVAISPAAEFTTTNTSVDFAWTASADAMSGLLQYGLQIASDPGFATMLYNVSTNLDTGVNLFLDADAHYYWRATAEDVAGNVAMSDSRHFIIVGNGPTSPNPISPADGTESSSLTQTFVWTASTDSFSTVTGYRFQIDVLSDFSSPDLFDSATGLATTATRTLAVNTEYYWRVIATNAELLTTTSATRSLITDTQIAVAPFSPPDDATTTETRPLFIWTSDGSQFRFELGPDTTGTGLKLDSSVTSKSLQPATALAGQTWYWRVVAQDTAGNTETTSWQTLTIDTTGFGVDAEAPLPFSLISPANGAATSDSIVLFNWNLSADTASGIAGYIVQIASDTAFASLVETAAVDAAVDTYASTELNGNDSYYWRVIAEDGSGNQRISTDSRLLIVDTVAPSSPAPLLSPPSGSDTALAAIAFLWSAASDSLSGVALYRLQADTLGTFVSPLQETTVSSTTVTLTGFTSNVWSWRVRAEDAAGNPSGWVGDTFRNIFVPPAIPSPVTPINGGLVSDSLVAFDWTDAADSGAALRRYRLRASTDSTFGAGILNDTTADSTSADTVSGFAVGAWYWQVAAEDILGNVTAWSEVANFRVLTPVPTLISPLNGAGTTAITVAFAVTMAGDTNKVARFNIQASTDSTFGAVLLSYLTPDSRTTFVPLYAFTTPGIWYWRIASVDNDSFASGYSNAESFTRTAPSESVPPAPPSDFTAIADNALGIGLSWRASPSGDMDSGGQYNLYWNLGVDGGEPLTLFKIVAHTGAESYAISTNTETTLTNGTSYLFRVRAQDRNGNEDSNPVTAGAVARSATPTLPYAMIFNPDAGRRVERNGGVQVMARLMALRNQAETILFQFRPIGGGVWWPMRAMTGNASTNPQTIGAESRTVYGLHWDALTDTTANDTTFELRALIGDRASGSWSTLLSPTNVIEFLAAGDRDSEYRSTAGTETSFLERRIDSRRSNHLAIFAGADSYAEIVLPANGLNATSDTVTAALLLWMDAARLGLGGARGAAIDMALGHDSPIGVAVTITLPGGQSLLLNGGVATITLSLAVDSRGYVRGLNIPLDSVVVRSFTDGAADSETLVVVSRDTVNGTITFQTTHFSTFLLVVPVFGSGGPGNQVNLSRFMVYPNPYRPNDGNPATGSVFDAANPRTTGIIFDNLPGNVKIEVYTMRGERVFERTTAVNDGFATWNVRNSANGNAVATGYYIYIVTDMATGQRVTGKLAVIR